MRLIDADALSEKLCKTTIFVKDGEVFQRMINDAPTVSAEPKTGEWVKREKIGLDENDTESLLYYWYECSECGHKPPCDSFRNEWHSSYCPSCGAKMKGGDSE